MKQRKYSSPEKKEILRQRSRDNRRKAKETKNVAQSQLIELEDENQDLRKRYWILETEIEYLTMTLGNYGVTLSSQSQINLQDVRDTTHVRDSRDVNVRDTRDTRDVRDVRETRVIGDTRNLRDARDVHASDVNVRDVNIRDKRIMRGNVSNLGMNSRMSHGNQSHLGQIPPILNNNQQLMNHMKRIQSVDPTFNQESHISSHNNQSVSPMKSHLSDSYHNSSINFNPYNNHRYLQNSNQYGDSTGSRQFHGENPFQSHPQQYIHSAQVRTPSLQYLDMRQKFDITDVDDSGIDKTQDSFDQSHEFPFDGMYASFKFDQINDRSNTASFQNQAQDATEDSVSFESWLTKQQLKENFSKQLDYNYSRNSTNDNITTTKQRPLNFIEALGQNK